MVTLGSLGRWIAGMAKPLRVEYEDAWRHVVSRGHERRRKVWDDASGAVAGSDAPPRALRKPSPMATFILTPEVPRILD